MCGVCKKQEGLIESLREQLKRARERAEEAENLASYHAHHEIHEGNCVTCYAVDAAREEAKSKVESLRAELGYYDAKDAMAVLKAQNDALLAENKRLRELLIRAEKFQCQPQGLIGDAHFYAAHEIHCDSCKLTNDIREALKSEGDGK